MNHTDVLTRDYESLKRVKDINALLNGLLDYLRYALAAPEIARLLVDPPSTMSNPASTVSEPLRTLGTLIHTNNPDSSRVPAWLVDLNLDKVLRDEWSVILDGGEARHLTHDRLISHLEMLHPFFMDALTKSSPSMEPPMQTLRGKTIEYNQEKSAIVIGGYTVELGRDSKQNAVAKYILSSVAAGETVPWDDVNDEIGGNTIDRRASEVNPDKYAKKGEDFSSLKRSIKETVERINALVKEHYCTGDDLFTWTKKSGDIVRNF